MNQTRKRVRSTDDNFTLQTKYFVNQKLVDESDEKLMKNVYDKTLEKIFNGAKLHHKSSQISESNREKNDSLIIDTLDDKSTEILACQTCIRDVDPLNKFQCNKCHLRLCTNCILSCQSCHSIILCDFCFNSGNRFADQPMCDRCLMFNGD